jgi:hypothetical protein
MEELGKFLASCEFTFPLYFWIGGALALLLIFFPVTGRKRGLAIDLQYWQVRVAFKSKRVLIFSILVTITSILIALALSDPQITVKPSVSIYGKPVVAVVDVSGSMQSKVRSYGAVDLRTGYEKARDIFQDLIGRRPDVNFALLLYSTESYVARYFSYKNELLKDTVENKQEIDYISTGTRTATALAKARKFLTDNVQGKDKAIVLISDLTGDLQAMVATAEEMERDFYAGIKIYVIVITPDNKIPTNAPTRLEGVEMVEMNDKAGIDQIVKEISDMQNSPIRQEEVVQKQSLIPFVILPGLALILAALVLTETRFRKIP